MPVWNPAQLDPIAAAEEIDAAYKGEYGYPSSPVDSITTNAAKATTIRVVPR
jgi:hypothetical protein